MFQVLLVEDDDSIRAFTALYLKRMGLEVVEAENGQHAMDILKGGVHPDLVITDVQMPKKSGFDLLAFIRGGSAVGPGKGRNVPVIVLTAHRHHLDAALQAGAQAALEKPVLYAALEPVVASFLPISVKK